VRRFIKAFADARNLHDGPAVAALYSENGEWLQNHGTEVVRGREALSRLWGGVTRTVERTVSSIEFPGPNIAIVRVATKYEPPTGLHSEVFVLVLDPTKTNWEIHVHQTLD
jgi:ketosteroid isomerase-like protein